MDNCKELLIASEIKAFLPMGWVAEWDVDSLLKADLFFREKTTFKGVSKVSDYYCFRPSPQRADAGRFCLDNI